MLESSVFGLIASPLACVLLLLVFGAVAIRVTTPRKRKRYEIIEEMSDPTPAQKAKWEREDAEWQKKNDDEAAWWHP